ncbi:aminoglycoside phosphotransferase family protein [Streptomyces sp. NBC_00588]|uniref:aminoglycoside phosphotransferase family protein n=1 Tax=Streptomyces sp. NBC_00588 TaxID=2975784 RepID=UPI002E7FDA2E|nr:aminoglycoside phosphotransferase family protein [Streptomyces sp. NBC_00588]WUB36593.1 aminoglycoside phosphotransferase family protein [Streptomyces sp. NBC_00588]
MDGDATAEVVDRGRHTDVVTPWERPEWRTAALEWVAGELAAHGLRVCGPRWVRLRPWSVLMRLPVEGAGAVWFKASPPAGLFEAGLTEALAGWVPEHVLKPVAVDAGRGWALLPDGGPRLADVLDEGPDDPRTWEELLRQYADLQRSLVPYAGRIEALGVPGARTAALPDLFDRLVAENGALTDDERAVLHGLRSRLVRWCEELAGLGIADSLDHADVHPGQVFVPAPGRFTFFDWGDANVSHPFCSFVVPAGHAVERYGPEVLPRLRDAYLEPWTGNGHTPHDLRRALRQAWRLGALGRARAWGRLFPDAAATTTQAGAPQSARSLLQLGDEPLV